MATLAEGAQGVGASDIVRARLTGKKIDWKNLALEVALLLCLLITLILLIVLLLDVLRKGLPVFAERGVDFLTSSNSSRAGRAGIKDALIGTITLTVITIVLAFPLGISAAVYVEEYAPDNRLTRLIAVNIRNLAGVPSVVYGLLGITLFVTWMKGVTGGPSVLSGGLALAILVLPIVIITTSEALRSVPYSIREAGFGIGATRWEVVRSHVLPYAAPGILTGTILSLARAIGETAPLILIGAVTGVLFTGSGSVMDQLQGKFTALPVIIFSWTRQPQDEFRELAAAAIIVLLVVLLTMNTVAILLRNRYERQQRGY